MNKKTCLRIIFWLVILTCAVVAVRGRAQTESSQQSSRSKWVGVWQGERDGQPSVILTLADDPGQLGGTLVLNIIENEGGNARIKATEPHLLMNTRLDGKSLSFQSRKLEGGFLDFNVLLDDTGNATIHCVNCGPDAPTVTLIRAQ